MNGNRSNYTKRTLEGKIYRTPAFVIISLFAAAAMVLFLFAGLIFLILGGGSLSGELDGVTYKYFGLTHDGNATLGTFRCSDGSGGSVAGDRVKFKDGSVYEGELSGILFEGWASMPRAQSIPVRLWVCTVTVTAPLLRIPQPSAQAGIIMSTPSLPA